MNPSHRFIFAAALLGTVPPAFAHGVTHDPAPRTTTAASLQQPWGIAGDPEKANRMIVVRMNDAMRFTPDGITVREGETVRFIVHNDGSVLHEMVIGTRETLDEHAAMMAKHPGMEHDEPWMTHVAPGDDAEMTWTFNRTGRFEFACLIPGHYQAGMVGAIVVETERSAPLASGNTPARW